MYEIRHTYKYEKYNSNIYEKYFGNLRIGFFDIETTGLSREKNRIILAGFAIPEDETITTYQYLADDTSEEPLLLKKSLEIMEKLDMVVTYNGKAFDMPFLSSRCRADKVHISTTLPYNLDLYQAVKNHSPLKGFLPNLRQKTVENFMGLWSARDDEISGAESVELYYHYAGTKDEKIREVILLHNRDDILQLSRLLPILDKCDVHNMVFAGGFPKNNLIITSIELTSDSLVISGVQRKNRKNLQLYDDFGTGIHASFRESEGDFNIHIPLISAEGLLLCNLLNMPFEHEESKEGFLILKYHDDTDYCKINDLVSLIIDYIDLSF